MPKQLKQASIVGLDEMVRGLDPEDRALFEGIFQVSVAEGRLVPPEAMHPMIKQRFGSVRAVRRQKIVKVTNLVTLEGALFNELRARRPMGRKEHLTLGEEIESDRGDDFCQPKTATTKDTFGRVRGRHCITASNIAKYDGFSGLVIFDEHNPLRFDRELFYDYVETSFQWAQKAHQADPQAKYFFLLWNCLWKSGATQVHGHFQMTLTRDMHYPKVERLRRAALEYRAKWGRDYFDDLCRAHLLVGCAFESNGCRVLAYLVPIKEKEVLILSSSMDDGMKEAIFQVAEAMTKAMGVASFNLALYMPPIAPVEEDWSGFPWIARMVDRGDLANRHSDMGGMELYATSVVASDPLAVARVLKERMSCGHR